MLASASSSFPLSLHELGGEFESSQRSGRSYFRFVARCSTRGYERRGNIDTFTGQRLGDLGGASVRMIRFVLADRFGND